MIFGIVTIAATVFAGECKALPQGDWAGKRVAILGDSISDAKIHAWKHWWKFVGEDLGTEMLVYAQNGCQWSGVPNQIKKMQEATGGDVDAILIFMGTNDFNSNVPLGDWWKETEEEVDRNGKPVRVRKRVPATNGGTLRGRINIALTKLKTDYPDRQIVLLTPIRRGFFKGSPTNVQPDDSYSNALGLYISDYARAVREAGEVWSVPVIDTHSESGLLLGMKSFGDCANREDTDRLHPNTEGCRRLALTVAARLRTLPPTFRAPKMNEVKP